jgi:hypothetical protein
MEGQKIEKKIFIPIEKILLTIDLEQLLMDFKKNFGSIRRFLRA